MAKHNKPQNKIYELYILRMFSNLLGKKYPNRNINCISNLLQYNNYIKLINKNT